MQESVEEIISDVAEMYGRRMGDTAIMLWAKAWHPYDASRLKAAMAAVIPEAEFFPSVHKLRTAVAHMYPTALAHDVANEFSRRNGMTASLPAQEEIDTLLIEWGKPPGSVRRSWLVL